MHVSTTKMAKRDIVVIGSSAGGVQALKELVTSLPADFKAPIFIVQHVAPYAISMLPEILNHAGSLKAVHPTDGDPIQPGHIYLAPPDHHLLVEKDRVLVKKGPKENRFRPSIDALFRSAAYTFGSRVVGVVLTGLLDDGTSGMWSIKRLGGLGIVQEPDDAKFSSMPASVLEYVNVDYVAPLTELGKLLCQVTTEYAPETPELSEEEAHRLRTEINIAAQKNAFEMGTLDIGELSPLACPECHGVLVRWTEGKLIRYRCHTGHTYTAGALLAEVDKSIEDNLWKSVRAIEEAIILLEESGKASALGGDEPMAKRFFTKATENRARAEKLHQFIFQQEQFLQKPA
ncbi:chemotaxis protein CheB [Spirosoma radiotolerans]|nr:chemotaxis protein CheB [Spirosoma radiotolerans]